MNPSLRNEQKYLMICTLLHNLSAAGPCSTMVWRMKEVTAASMTWEVMPPWASLDFSLSLEKIDSRNYQLF